MAIIYHYQQPEQPVTTITTTPSDHWKPSPAWQVPSPVITVATQQHGKLMLLHLCSKPTLVVSSPNVAKEIMKTHDIIFANLLKLRNINQIFYDCNEIAFGQYGEKWRRMKKIAVTHLLSNKKVQSFRAIREEEVGLLVEKVRNNVDSPINLSGMFFSLANDLVSRTSLGRKYKMNTDNERVDFEEVFKELTEVLGMFSVGDFIPWLGWIDLIGGLQNRVAKVRQSFDDLLDRVVKEHVEKVDNGVNVAENEEKMKDFVDVLLHVQRDDPSSLSKDNVYGLILDMIVGATETTQTLLEWTMTGLLRNPIVMKQLQNEVRQMIKDKKRVTEDDLCNMQYLKAVIKETLRLHPPIPLLVFRESSQDVEINGYEVVANTQVIINAWAIQRDPDWWDKPDVFKPERFLMNLTMDFRDQSIEFIPFGAGRRSCPGASYGLPST